MEDVEAALVEATAIYRRHQLRGGSPFAKDGPWHLFRHEAGEHGAYDATRLPRVPPSREELARMRIVLEWLMLVPEDDDRRLIVKALMALAQGDARVPWSRLVEDRRRWRTGDGLRMRYDRALSALCVRVNRLPRSAREG